MNKIKKIFLAVSILFVFGLFAAPVLAAPNINEITKKVAGVAGYDESDTSETALSQRVGGIVKIALSFVGTLFLALTVYAGFLWMTASGNEDQVKKATSILTMATVGLIIVLAAYGVTSFIVGRATSGMAQTTVSGGGSDESNSESYINCGTVNAACVNINENNGNPCNPPGIGSKDPYSGNYRGWCGVDAVCCEFKSTNN